MSYNFKDLHKIKRREEYTRSNDTRYIAEIKHQGLGSFRVLKDMNSYLLNTKIDEQFLKWDEQWAKIIEKRKLQEDKDASLNLADERTLEAQKQQKEIENILFYTLNIDDTIDWEALKNKNRFNIPNPKNNLKNEIDKIKRPNALVLKSLPFEPIKEIYEPKFNILDKLFKTIKQKKIGKAETKYQIALNEWQNTTAEVKQKNIEIEIAHREALAKYESKKAEI